MKKSIEWRQITIEMTSIIFAVLLALGLEGWMQDRELNERADKMLERINSEISENRDALKESMMENKSYIDGIMAAAKDGEFVFDDIAPFIKLSAGGGEDAAWSSAKMTNAISVMPLDTMKSIANIYSTQTYYTEYSRALMLMFADMTVNIQKPEQTKDQAYKFLTHLRVLDSLATSLNTLYDEHLDGGDTPPKLDEDGVKAEPDEGAASTS